MKTHYRPSFLLRPRRWLNTLVATLFFAEMSLPSVSLAGGITAAPGGGANRPTVDTSGNGVPVINIVRPDGKGVSHNKYQDFNVPGQGAILNNSGKETQTRLAGWIDKNSGFAPGDSARLILNEVTGPDISRLAGYLEVAGNRADVIIANPNGIHGSNFGFINTSRALLTTGRPEFDAAGDLRSF
ncbi:MAG: filamentous hemagglutinin N-terminal domain-containing protein, partial [Opitutaceae bacterium]|nr:filamentous hemagglutinin N-terminal domain-containing protein [Opitutaceae bacterium]